MIKLPNLRNADVKGKRVFLRLDLDVPLTQHLRIADDTRLKDSLETLNFLLENGATVIIGGHLGRPDHKFKSQKSKFKIEENKFSLKPVAQWFGKEFKIENLKLKVENFEGLRGWRITDSLFLLENLRFDPGEEANPSTSPLTMSSGLNDSGQVFAKKLASLADIYVNDAFASSHRAHASIVGTAKLLPHFAGLQLAREIETLSYLLENPKRPLVVIIGGAKIETKLPLVSKMHKFADYVLVGEKIAEETRVLLKVQHEKVENRKSALLVADLNNEQTDVTPKDVENFVQIVNLSQTVVWNGPIGVTEGKEGNYEIASYKLAKGIIDVGAYSVVGGGDTIGYLKKVGLLNKFSFVSTGGGAMLEFLSGEIG